MEGRFVNCSSSQLVVSSWSTTSNWRQLWCSMAEAPWWSIQHHLGLRSMPPFGGCSSTPMSVWRCGTPNRSSLNSGGMELLGWNPLPSGRWIWASGWEPSSISVQLMAWLALRIFWWALMKLSASRRQPQRNIRLAYVLHSCVPHWMDCKGASVLMAAARKLLISSPPKSKSGLQLWKAQGTMCLQPPFFPTISLTNWCTGLYSV